MSSEAPDYRQVNSGVEQRSRDLQENFPKSTGVCPLSYLAEWKRETAGPGSGKDEGEEEEGAVLMTSLVAAAAKSEVRWMSCLTEGCSSSSPGGGSSSELRGDVLNFTDGEKRFEVRKQIHTPQQKVLRLTP
ncbi:unnamed protein product [Boreogadus saida]